MNLNSLWFILIAVLYIGFFFLEGFDFGVGMLLPFMSKKDVERRAVLNTIGPHWDGNEVWLITAGGATFAAFPVWYSSMFSGFYVGMFLLLVALILRGVAIEFRSKVGSPRWRQGWDTAICASGFAAAFLLGVVFTNLVRGVPINADLVYTGTFFTLLNPLALLGGLAVVGLFLLHGATFLNLKLMDELQQRAARFAQVLWVAVLLVAGAYLVALLFGTGAFASKGALGWILPVLAALALVLVRVFLARGRGGLAFAASGLAIIFAVAGLFAALFPNLMISSTDPAYSLTITNAASSPYTLRVMTIVAAVMVPVVLAYQAWTYWVFRRRVKADPQTLTY